MWHMAILLKYDGKYKIKIHFTIYYILIIHMCHSVWVSTQLQALIEIRKTGSSWSWIFRRFKVLGSGCWESNQSLLQERHML